MLLADYAGRRIDRLARLRLFGWAEPGATEDEFWAVRKMFEHLAARTR